MMHKIMFSFLLSVPAAMCIFTRNNLWQLIFSYPSNVLHNYNKKTGNTNTTDSEVGGKFI